MGPRHYVYVLLFLLTSTACSPTAPTTPVLPTPTPPIAGLPDGRLVIQEVSARPFVSHDGATVFFEPWVTLRETTGTSAVSVTSVVVTIAGPNGATVINHDRCITRPRVEPGGAWDFDSLYIYCRDPLPTPLTAFTITIAYSDTSNNRLGGIVQGSWAPTP